MMSAPKTDYNTVRQSESSRADAVLTVRYYIAPDRANDKIYLADGRGYFFSDWMRATQAAVTTCQRYNAQVEMSKREWIEYRIAAHWLWLCGIKKFDDDKILAHLNNETLPLLRLPPDSPQMSRRCAKCGSRIWGREAILTGLGSECRRSGMAHRTTRRSTRRIAAMQVIEVAQNVSS